MLLMSLPGPKSRIVCFRCHPKFQAVMAHVRLQVHDDKILMLIQGQGLRMLLVSSQIESDSMLIMQQHQCAATFC